MYELEVERMFSAAHHLRNYDGKCAAVHGHNWTVRVIVRASRLNETGMAVDFKVLKRELDALLLTVDHKDLNEVPPFTAENPTSENLVRYFFRTLSAKLNDGNVRIHCVRISETPGSTASYYGEETE